MTTIKTGSWTVTFDVHGLVSDVHSDEHRGSDELRALVVKTIEDDRSAGFAPADPSTWGFAYKEHLKWGGDAYYWLSYLSLVWNVLLDGDKTEHWRRATAKDLEQMVADMIAFGSPPDRLQT